MHKRTIVLFLLSGLLIACASATPTGLPTATVSSATSVMPTQTSSHNVTPIPSAALTQPRLPTLEATPTPPPGSEFSLEQVAQKGGSINGITVVDDMAYIGMGPRVAAIDISQHAHPQLVRQSEPLPGTVSQLLQISGGPTPHLLVNAGKYLVMIDITNPDELNPVHQLELAGAISAMVWDARLSIIYAGGSIYKAPDRYTGFISAVGITPDNHLKLINSVAMPEWPLSLALGEGSLFAGAQGYKGGLYHIQVNNSGELSTPDLVIASIPEKPLQPLSMQVIGDHLFLGYRDMEAYDITHPDQPVQTWTENLGGIVVKDFNVAGEQIYIFGWTIKSEYVLDAITLPEPIAGSPMGEIAAVTAIHDGDFMVAYNDLKIYETANPQDLQLLGTYQSPVSNAIDAVVNDKAVFMVEIGIGDGHSQAVLRVLSLPALEPLGQLITEFPASRNDFHGIALDSDRVYLASEDSVWVYDVSRAEPTLLGRLEISGGGLETITAIELAGKRLLVISQEISQSSVLTTYDLTDLQVPARMGNPLTLDKVSVIQMTWNGSALYAILESIYAGHIDMLYIFDFDENVPSLKESLQLPGYITSMAVETDLVSLIGTEGLSIVSAVEPGPLKLLTHITLPEFGVGVAIINDKALVVVGDEYGAAKLLTFDIQDPRNPRQVDAVDIAISRNPVVPILVTKPYVVLVNGTGGVEVLDYDH